MSTATPFDNADALRFDSGGMGKLKWLCFLILIGVCAFDTHAQKKGPPITDRFRYSVRSFSDAKNHLENTAKWWQTEPSKTIYLVFYGNERLITTRAAQYKKYLQTKFNIPSGKVKTVLGPNYDWIRPGYIEFLDYLIDSNEGPSADRPPT